MLVCAGALAQAPSAGMQAGQAYPTREIRFIVPFPPGAGNDMVGRIVARKLQESLGQEVIVENRGGAGGTIGTNIVAKAPPDGYTMLINNISLAVNATLMPKLPYDTQKDLTPVSIVGRQPSVVLVRAGLEAKSIRELVRLARQKPGQLIYGSGGPGSSSHLATERFLMVSGMQMTHVPYKGLDEAVTDLASGRVDMVITTAGTALLQVANRNLRALAVTTARRSPLFPQLPTMMEAGVPGFEVSTWYALLVPAKTPKQIVARLNGELGRIANAAEVKELFAAKGLDTDHTTPEQARAYIKSEIKKWGTVVKASGIKPQ
jgi:tripartite-type tricarboxylate transporter receptor subunit TctC